MTTKDMRYNNLGFIRERK